MPAAGAFVPARRRRRSAKIENCRAGPVPAQEIRVTLPLRRCFFCGNHAPAGALSKASSTPSRPLLASLSLLRQNRQAELASLKDDLLRCLLFGVDPIESDKGTQKFESQSVASGQGKPPRALVVLLRRETRSLHTQKRQIGSQISTK